MLNSGWGIANPGLGKAFELTGSLNPVNIRNVKSEPLDESIKHGFTGATPIPKGLPDIRAVKRELVERCNPEALKPFNFSSLKLVDPRSIKPEPVREDIRETLKKTEGTSNQSDKQMVEAMDIRGKTTSSAALSTSGEVSNPFEHSMNRKGSHLSGEVPQEKSESSGQVPTETMSAPVGLDGNASNLSREVPQGNNLSREVSQEKSESARQVLTETVSASVGHDGNVSNVSSLVDAAIAEDKNIDDTEQCRLKFMEEVPPNSRGNGEGSASDDEEKINLSGDMLEEDSYGSDYESDANHNLETAMDAEHNNGREEDFEDGEVREPLAHTEQEGPICEKRELQHFDSGDSSDNKRLDFVGPPSDRPSTSSSVEDKPTKTEEPSETNNDNMKEFSETTHDEKDSKGAGSNDAILQKPSAGEMPANEGDQKRCGRASPIRPVVMLNMKDGLKGQETELSYDQATSSSQGNSAAVAQGYDENVKRTDVVEKSVSPSPKAEASSIIDDPAKDASSGGNKSRIINLPRVSNMPSPGQTRTISGRPLPPRVGRERLTDVALEGEILHPRGRDEIYTDASHKFSRERHQDHPSRNSRLNFVRGRGRISSRIDTLQGDWNSERDFPPDFYNGPAEFHVPRHKYASQPDPEFNGYNAGLNGPFVGTGRGGRKILNDEPPVFRHLPRRRSPGGRMGPHGRGLDMVRRVPRNISPSGCIGQDGTELVGLRRGEKFMRGLPNDNTDPMFTHPQAAYEGLDGHFVRSNRNFLPMQRRGIPRIRSKSPIGSRTRSPGTWSPPRRRSPDGFGGHPELPNRRSPPIYRMERMRSPDHSCFPGEMVVRRHGSPYMSRPPNEVRDMDSSRDLAHPRSAMPNRSPSGRVLLRNTRRFDIVDPRERTDGDDYFGRPMHPGRFQELGADGTGEERRRFGERRGPVRPFRPPYNGVEGENFHLNAGDGLRTFRFCPEDGPEFHERGNLREREFDRRIKNRPGNGPRRTRNIEEQEGNYRHGGQVWHDNGFDDMSRMKRKKF
ncbi:hypothetical protein Pint_06168 [Pistacia integerrima]|uniref:Uncharacterized protein n=1 Tax=Pistacia integerrima TaxID=434235 RepID=A0ACC0Z419_9ROSI|nr:hypothetical protein Pint_06168 [Pistacia integerrima]